MTSSKRCLIVDDSGVIRKVTRVILEDLRFSVQEAENAQEALELCKAEMPALILLDWHIQGMNPSTSSPRCGPPNARAGRS